MAILDDLAARSADPGAVSVALERIAESDPTVLDRSADDRAFAARLVAVISASRSMTTLLSADPLAVEQLAELDHRAPVGASSPKALVAWKKREYLRIAARDLVGIDQLEQTGSALSRMAAEVLHAACLVHQTRGLAVIGMGKLAGDELNYASDVDVIFVGDGMPEDLAEQARAVVNLAGQCFRVDTDLRPEGPQGALVRTMISYEQYWDQWAEPWEFQALLKHRAVAGTEALGDHFSSEVAERIWTREWSADDLRQLRHLKTRTEEEVARKGLADREVKRGPGGIRDVEFSVQLLQLVHGRHDPTLRIPNTLLALAELRSGGYVDVRDAAQLEDSYRFLRRVEHRLQLVDERQTHTLPKDESARRRLALVMGFRDAPRESATEAFDAELARHRGAVRRIHEGLWFRPLLESFSQAPEERGLDDDVMRDRLAATGFSDVQRTEAAVKELTQGLTRTSRLMQQYLPLLLNWLADSPDPDLGLLGFRFMMTGGHRQRALVAALRDSPEVARRLATILGTSRMLGDILQREPDLVDQLSSIETAPADLDGAAASFVAGAGDDLGQRLRRLRDRETFTVASADLLGLLPIEEVERRLGSVAESICRASLDQIGPTLPFAVIALGRFGGGELSYASDLDLVFVYDGEGSEAQAEAEQIGRAWRDLMRGRHATERIYDNDLDLRPEGTEGTLTRSREGYRIYHQRWAEVWERQAMLRARPVAGDPELGARFVEMLRPFVWQGELSDGDVREIRRIKARVEKERIPRGEDPEFHLKLGPGALADVEWTAQLLQLQSRVPGEGTLAALAALAEAGVLADEDAAVLVEAYRFCTLTRDRLFLLRGAKADSLPARGSGDLTRLSLSLDIPATELRETYRRLTRRSRAVVERVFYGQ